MMMSQWLVVIVLSRQLKHIICHSLGIAVAFNEELSYNTRCAKLLGVPGPDDPNPLVKMAMVTPHVMIMCI